MSLRPRGWLKRALLLLVLAGVGVAAFEVVHTARSVKHEFAEMRHPVAVPDGAPELVKVDLVTGRGKQVHGWYVPSTNGAAVMLAHGSFSDRTQLWAELLFFHQAGYGVLTFDWPGMGESEGPNRLGTIEREAFEVMLVWLKARPEVHNVGLYGFSLGAALALQAAAGDKRIEAAVFAGAFTDGVQQTAWEYRHANPIVRWTAVAVEHRYIEGGNIRPANEAPKLKGTPTLFIAGSDDDVVPPQMAKELAELGGGELWMIAGSGHGEYAKTVGAEWPTRLLRFFGQHLHPIPEPGRTDSSEPPSPL